MNKSKMWVQIKEASVSITTNQSQSTLNPNQRAAGKNLTQSICGKTDQAELTEHVF